MDKRYELCKTAWGLYHFDLSVTEDQSFDVAYHGRTNTVQIEQGRIRVLNVDCPNQTCTHMGLLNSGALPICLPNLLIIEYTDAEEAVDAVVQ